ncbi:unnamed protein product [marine sediment metagenome]|uniref:Uncharacterized protein n=1 Tax=marine sediment metagenome TaxID=412755 RepID=X1B6M1_9ZZZZ
MKKIKAHQCSYCSFYRISRQPVLKHEKKCFKNPENKACASCKHNTTDYDTIYNRHHGGDPGSTDYDIAYNYCVELDIVLNNYTLKKGCALYSKID